MGFAIALANRREIPAIISIHRRHVDGEQHFPFDHEDRDIVTRFVSAGSNRSIARRRPAGSPLCVPLARRFTFSSVSRMLPEGGGGFMFLGITRDGI